MSLWNDNPDVMLVAGHRGARVNMPENTMTAFRHAVAVGCDMIETDIRQTKDHQLVLMHDKKVDRTTDGTGNVCDFTLAEIRKLNAAAHVEGVERECVPLLSELFELTAKHPTMLLNLELKDYPDIEGEAWAYETADKTIAMMEEYGLGKRCIINSFSGKLLDYVHRKYNHRYPIHGFYPYFYLRKDCGNPDSYLTAACLFNSEQAEDGSIHSRGGQVCPKEWFDDVAARGIEPWIGAGVKTFDDLKTCAEYGARLVTTDNPEETLSFLRKMGRHQ